ncbi:MAG: hypothetical protein LAT64_10820 [Phycisphaerales bacterium]|nr:hypothetical protein [Planctomycetota bacterium]MCH8509242.1 hypothetical protein [Phycisphaerales bacterium]
MKVKGINPIEQHIEKIVLGLVLLALLAVLALQFLTQPNQVQAGTRAVPPQDVFVVLQRQAESIDSQIKDTAPALPPVQETDLVQRYDRAFEGAASGPVRLAAPLGRPLNIAAATGADIGSAGPSSDEVAVLRVPRTSKPMAGSQWGTLDPFALIEVPEYARFVPEAQPYDFPSVTIEATFSGTALREVLSPAEGAGVPRRFWQGTGIALLGFEAERQRRLPDGSWSDPEPITLPPGSARPTRAVTPEDGLPELTEVVSNANAAAPDVQRPLLPPIIAGPEWLPPSERVADARTQLSRADRIRRDLERAVAELERLESPGGARDPRQPADRERRPTVTRDPGAPTPANQRRIEQLRRQIEDYRNELRELGEPDPTQQTGVAGRSDDRPTIRPSAQAGQIALLEQETVQLWTHDLGIEPGATYRYRTRAVVNNPLFRKGPVLDQGDSDLQAASSQPFSRGAWSDWSEPVVVGAREYYFIAAADAEGALSSGRSTATVEVFRMYYGHYRKASLTLSPGDPVEGTLRVPENLYLMDTRVLEAREAAEALAGEGGSLPAGMTRSPSRLPVRLGAVLLDVAARPVPVTDELGRTITQTEVILRGPDGGIIVRIPRRDTASPSYTQANASANAPTRNILREPGVQPARSPSADLFRPRAEEP